MAETLVAILLVTSSGGGKSVSFWWPPRPEPLPRVSRALPGRDAYTARNTDVLWRSAFSPDFAPLKRNGERPYNASGSDWQGPTDSEDLEVVVRLAKEDEDSYGWQPPTFARKRAPFQPQAASSGRSSPVVERSFDARPPPPLQHKDDMIMPMILGYPASALASLLAPANLCHQKFELLVDELVFIGHPVCRDPDGFWPPASTPDGLPSSQDSREESPNADHQSSLHLFHVVFVLDRPDASSASSGNLAQYYDIIYRHIAFKLTAALYAEQGARALVDNETEYLEDLKQKFLLRDAGEPAANKYKDPVDAFIQAARECSIASAIQQTYTAIKNNRLVDFIIGKIRVQIQLPPSLDSILHDSDEADYPSDLDDDESRGISTSHTGGDLTQLSPGKALLLNADDMELEIVEELNQAGAFQPKLKQEMLEFLDTARPNLTFNEIRILLDCEWETVWSKVRVLVAHRKAIIIDPIPPTLRVTYVPVAGTMSLDTAIQDFEAEFRTSLTHDTEVPSLPVILSAISVQPQQNFATALNIPREKLPIWTNVLKWLIRRRLIVRLHTRVRVRVPTAIKELVQKERKALIEEKRAQRLKAHEIKSPSSAFSEKRGRTRTRESKVSWANDKIVNTPSGRTSLGDSTSILEEEEDEEDIDWHNEDDNLEPSIIPTPRKATPLQRSWLQAMTREKSPRLTELFIRLAEYFDGCTTEEEILQNNSENFTPQQFREVIWNFKEYLIISLHP